MGLSSHPDPLLRRNWTYVTPSRRVSMGQLVDDCSVDGAMNPPLRLAVIRFGKASIAIWGAAVIISGKAERERADTLSARPDSAADRTKSCAQFPINQAGSPHWA